MHTPSINLQPGDIATHAGKRHLRILEQVLAALGHPARSLKVADASCGDGAHCQLWAERGHEAFGADSDPAQITLARTLARAARRPVVFEVGTPGALPWPERSMDVCLAGEQLAQGDALRASLAELVRVLKPGALLYFSSASRLDPQRHACYLGLLQRGYDAMACQRFTHELRAHLQALGMAVVENGAKDAPARSASAACLLVQAVPPLRLCAYPGAPTAGLLAFKKL